jgi:hypothetical protein
MEADNMPWARLDDRFSEHPKIVGLTDRAFRLHVSAIVYAARNRTDGRIAASLPRAWGFMPRHVQELVSSHLWDPIDGGWAIHDYLDYNPSRAEAEEREQRLSGARRQAGRRGAEARWQTDGKRDGNAMANAMATRWQNDGKRDGKPMANAMATRWQNDGPDPLEEEDISRSRSGSSSSGDRDRGHRFAMAFAILPWAERAAEILGRAGRWKPAEANLLEALSADYSEEQIESALERVEARAQLPFAQNLRRELVAEFGEPDWVRARRGPARYG